MRKTRGVLRAPILIAFAFVALVSGAVGAAWIERAALVRWAALRAIDRLELGPASLVIDAVSLGSVRAHQVSLRGGALRIGAVSATFNPLALMARHIARIDAAGLDVALELVPEGVRLGGKPLGGSGGGTLPAWRIDDAALVDTSVAVRTDKGELRATLSSNLALGGGVVSAHDVAGEITISMGGAPLAVNLTARGITAAPGVPGLPLLSLTQAAIEPDSVPWRASGLDATISSAGDRLAAIASVAQLAQLSRPALVAPLRLRGEASLAGGKVEFSLSVATVARSPFSIEATGRYELNSASGSLVLAMAPLVFKPQEFQPRDLAPALGGFARNVTGSLGLAGSIAWHDGTLAPDLLLRLGDLAFTTDAAQIRGLTAAIRLTKLWPPATAPHQALSATIEAPGMPAAKVSLRGRLTGKPALAIEEFAAEIAGGEIAATPVTIDPAALALATTLRVSHLDLAELTKLLAIDGLSGTGALDGDIPLSLANHKLAVRNGKLAAKGPGVLRYQPQRLPPQIAAAGQSVDLALKALSDFHYDRLSLELDKSAEGEGTVLLHMEGSNPAVMSGQPFTFNIRVESNFDRLADYALLSLRSAQDLLRRAAGRSEP
jgi:hypothetical protein